MLRRLPAFFPRPGRSRPLLSLLAGCAVLAAVPVPVSAASALLETVKQNPALAQTLCARFKELNAQGLSATSRPSVDWVARSQGLSPMDAEVFITYVVGLHCPDVR